MRVQFKNDGTTNVWDGEHGHVPEFEWAWFFLYLKRLIDLKVNIEDVEFEMPNGWQACLIRNPHSPDGYSVNLK